jgi:hypothetical protein
MLRVLSTVVLGCGLGIGVLGCDSDSGAGSPQFEPSGTAAQTPQGNMQGPAHSNGTEGADTAQNIPPIQQSPAAPDGSDQRMGAQGRLPVPQPQQ